MACSAMASAGAPWSLPAACRPIRGGVPRAIRSVIPTDLAKLRRALGKPIRDPAQPQEHHHGRLIDVLHRADVVGDPRIEVAAAKEAVTITSDDPDLGEVRQELEAEYTAEPIAVGVNPEYVVELLNPDDQRSAHRRARW